MSPIIYSTVDNVWQLGLFGVNYVDSLHFIFDNLYFKHVIQSKTNLTIHIDIISN